MANKYFKSTLTPKKSHPDSPSEIVTYSDQFKTQKEFSDACISELSEVESVTLWFAPKIERITQEEFEANNDSELGEEAENQELQASSEPLPQSDEIEELKEQYHFFQYAKGYPILVKLQKLSGKVRASYMFNSYQFVEIDKEFTKLENGLVNALGYVIDDCSRAGLDGCAWGKATIKGIAGRNPDSFFYESIISHEEVLKLFNSEPEVKSYSSWETNDDIKYKKLYSKIVDIISVYNGDEMPSAGKCYTHLVASVPPKYTDVADLESRILRVIASVKNPHNFTNAINATQIIIQAFQDLESDDCPVAGLSAEVKQDVEEKTERMVFSITGDCKFFIEISGDKFHKVKYNIHGDNFEYRDTAELDNKSNAIIFALNRIKAHLLNHINAALVNSVINGAKSDPVKWFDACVNDAIPCEQTRSKNTNNLPTTAKKEPLDTKLTAEVVKNEPEPNESLPTDFEKMVNDYNEKIENLALGEVVTFDDMPNEIYHAVVGVSSSKIKDAMRSLMYYNAKHNTKEIEPETGDQFDIGNVFHSIALEPDMTSKEYICEPSGKDTPKKPTEPQWEKFNAWHALGCPEKADNPKAYPTDLMLERCGFWKDFYEENADLYPIDAQNWKLAENMAISALSDSDASLLLKHPARKAERSYFKRCDVTGMIIKARPDIEVGKIIGDLKSIALRGSFDEKYLLTALRKEIYNRNYHLSAAMYLDICGKDRFVWIFTNKQKGYHWTATLRASEKILFEGIRLYVEYKQKIADAYNSGNWSKPESIQSRVNPENGKIELPEV